MKLVSINVRNGLAPNGDKPFLDSMLTWRMLGMTKLFIFKMHMWANSMKLVSIDSRNGLLPKGDKPFLDSMVWRLVAAMPVLETMMNNDR